MMFRVKHSSSVSYRAIAAAAAAVALLLAGCGGRVSAAGDSASDCTGCHEGRLSLAGRDVDELAGAIRSIRDGELGHPPLGLDDDSDEAIAELAAALAGE